MIMLRTLRRSRRALYRAARVEGDVIAVGSHHVARRVVRRRAGRLFGRTMRKLLP